MTGHPAVSAISVAGGAAGADPVAAGVAGALIVAGLLAAGAALLGSTANSRPAGVGLGAAVTRIRRRLNPANAGTGPPPPSGAVAIGGARPSSVRARTLVAAAAGMGSWWVTTWPVAGVIAVAAVLGLPPLLGTSKVSTARIAQLEALEDWTRRLGDVLTVGVGLEQAITASLRTTPAAIAPHVGALAARLGARWPTETALRAFADDLHDATGDLVAAALILGSRRRGPGLATVLDGLADTVAEEVTMRRKVEADRARPRTTARWVTLITLGVIAAGALNATYIRPYGTGVGQLVLAGLISGFAAALLWMRSISSGSPEPRFLPGTTPAPRPAPRSGAPGSEPAR